MFEPSGPRFITVDLEVWSRADLAALAAAVEPHGSVQYAGKARRKFLVSIVAASRSRSPSPEQMIWALLDVVATFSPKARRLWKQADSRIFSIGYEGGDFITLFYERPVGSGRWFPGGRKKATPCETSLSPELLRAVAKVEGTIATTIYPPAKQVSPRRSAVAKTR